MPVLIAEVEGGPLDGDRIEIRHQHFSVQQSWAGHITARHHYTLVDGVYRYGGLLPVQYATAGEEAAAPVLPPNRRRR